MPGWRRMKAGSIGHSTVSAACLPVVIRTVPIAAPRAWDSASISSSNPASAGDKALALADDVALKAAEDRCRSMVQRALNRQDVSGWVRMMLREARHGMPSMEEMAHTLNMSPRSLDRYLQREGAGYRALLQQVRHERAQRLLLNSGTSITQIALELGYTDAANFTRAFRKIEGVSPSVFRTRST